MTQRANHGKLIPFAYAPEAQNPGQAEITTANFNMVEPVTRTLPVPSSVHQPLVLKNFSSSPSPAEPMTLDDVAYWGYHIQGINQRGAVDDLVASYCDILVLEPTRTDWSSADKIFDTRAMVTELKNSQASEMIVQMRPIATSAITHC